MISIIFGRLFAVFLFRGWGGFSAVDEVLPGLVWGGVSAIGFIFPP
jgi:hypothetical protein